MDDEKELTPQERAALTGWMFAHLKPGMGIDTSEVAQWTGLTESGARHLLCTISRWAVPIYNIGRKWFLIEKDDEICTEPSE